MNNRPEVKTRVEELRRKLSERSDITKDRVVAEYAKIAFSSISHLHKTWIDRVAFEELTEEQKASIESIDTRIQRREIDDKVVLVEQVKIKLYNKITALDSLSKMLGFNEPQKVELSGEALEKPRNVIVIGGKEFFVD